MLTDIWTIASKELKEIFQRTNTKGAGKWSFIIYILIFGVFVPLSNGVDSVISGTAVIFLLWLPFLLIISVVTDSFAGERERHTLETLLSTRLSDRAILFGKMGSALIYGGGLTLICFLLSLVAVNVASFTNGTGEFINYPGWAYGAVFFSAIFLGLLATTMGVLSSLRAPTARQAAQRLSLFFMAFFLPIYIVPMLPAEFTAKWGTRLLQVDPVPFVIGGCIILIALDLILMAVAMMRFKRSEMILD